MTMLKPDVFTSPFAASGDVTPMTLTTSLSEMNQITGIPAIFATPYSAGGLPVPVDQTNGVFYSYSTQSVWLQGGGTFTFELAWVTANGGYDNGVILYDAASNLYVQSLHNNNTADFVSNPDLINGTDWEYFPSQLIASSGIPDNFGQVNVGYANGGDGNYKPYALLNSQLSVGGYLANFFITAAGTGTAYEGLVSSMRNQIDDNNYSIIEMYPQAGSPVASWYLTSGGVTNTGIGQTVGLRPFLEGTDVAALSTSPTSIAILYDFPSSNSPTLQTQYFPSGGSIQIGNAIIPMGSTGVSVTLPTGYPNAIISAVATLNSTDGSYWVVACNIVSPTTIQITINIAAPSNSQVNFMVMGY